MIFDVIEAMQAILVDIEELKLFLNNVENAKLWGETVSIQIVY